MCVPPALMASARPTASAQGVDGRPEPEPGTLPSLIQRFGLPSVMITTRSGLPPANPPNVLCALMRPSSQLV